MQHMKRRDIIMKMKKLLVLGLSAVMAAAMLTGCGGSDKKEENPAPAMPNPGMGGMGMM